MKAIGYARTSTQRQDLSLEVQENRLLAEAGFRNLDMEIVKEKVSGSIAPLSRPGLSQVLEKLATGQADTLVVAKLDRVARSMGDIANLLELAKEQNWNFIALDLGVDTSTPEGTLVVGIMASIAQWERSRIQERTREALAQAKENGKILGRPSKIRPVDAKKAATLRRQGSTLSSISKDFFERGLTTSAGARLSSSSVQRLLDYAKQNNL